MIDRDSVGRRGARFRFPVEEGKIRELARATFSTQPAYLGERPMVPPTFLKLSQFAWEVPGRSAVDLVGFDPANPPLHAEQEFSYDGRPPVAGDVLWGQTVVESIQDKPSRTYGSTIAVVIATEYEDASGRRVAVARSTSMVRPVPAGSPIAPAVPAGGAPAPATPAPAPATPATPAPAGSASSGGAAPDPIPTATAGGAAPPGAVAAPPPPGTVGPLTLTDLVRYQGAGGDMNPSHHDDAFARRTGSPGVFAPGLLSAALLADWATAWLGPERCRRFGVRFRSQVFLGDVLTLCGAVSGAGSSPEGPTVELALECRRQDGSVATAGWATFLVG